MVDEDLKKGRIFENFDLQKVLLHSLTRMEPEIESRINAYIGQNCRSRSDISWGLDTVKRCGGVVVHNKNRKSPQQIILIFIFF